VVPGEGPKHAPLAGHPFADRPAGCSTGPLWEPVSAARAIFVTNAVKNFKFEQRSKRPLRKRPSAYKIKHRKWCNDIERASDEAQARSAQPDGKAGFPSIAYAERSCRSMRSASCDPLGTASDQRFRRQEAGIHRIGR
jgi:hypothetical protein